MDGREPRESQDSIHPGYFRKPPISIVACENKPVFRGGLRSPLHSSVRSLYSIRIRLRGNHNAGSGSDPYRQPKPPVISILACEANQRLGAVRCNASVSLSAFSILHKDPIARESQCWLRIRSTAGGRNPRNINTGIRNKPASRYRSAAMPLHFSMRSQGCVHSIRIRLRGNHNAGSGSIHSWRPKPP
eukprot:COSAG02_NODE_11502_length_1711_cov_4.795285_3_plen_188_part_00